MHDVDYEAALSQASLDKSGDFSLILDNQDSHETTFGF